MSERRWLSRVKTEQWRGNKTLYETKRTVISDSRLYVQVVDELSEGWCSLEGECKTGKGVDFR